MIRASRKAATCKSYPFRPRTKFFPEYVLYHFAFGLQSKYLPRSARSQRELGLAFSPTCIPARISWRSWGKSVQNTQTHSTEGIRGVTRAGKSCWLGCKLRFKRQFVFRKSEYIWGFFEPWHCGSGKVRQSGRAGALGSAWELGTNLQ